MSEKDYIELVIQGIESELQQEEISVERRKSILMTRLTPSLRDLVRDLQADHMTTFEEIKARLLDCAGITSTQAGQQFFDLRQQDVRKKSTSQLIQQVDRLINRLLRDATTMQEVCVLPRFVLSSQQK